jgi:predicted nucleotidyltransferase
MIPYKTLFKELEDKKIAYLIAGGFAVNFHNVQRSTVDIDLVLHLTESNIFNFVSIMKDLGFAPRLPVRPEDFADPKIRQTWIEEKNMMVFSFNHNSNPLEIIDIFVEEPKPFTELFNNRLEVPFGDITLKVIGKTDLIEMKERAGRPKDLYDILELKKLS